MSLSTEKEKRKGSGEESTKQRRVKIKAESAVKEDDPLDERTPNHSPSAPSKGVVLNNRLLLEQNECWTKLSPVQKVFLEDLRSPKEDVVHKALKQLVALCDSNTDGHKENREIVAQICGSAMIVAAMRAFIASSDIQAVGCKALAYVAAGYDFGPRDVALFRSMKVAGALHAIIWAMVMHPSANRVQGLACFALGNMCDLEENATQVVLELNGHARIVAAMKQFPYEARLQLEASRALLILSKWRACRQPIVNAEGIEVLGAAIRLHQNVNNDYVKDIQSKANRALNRLTKLSNSS